MVSQPDSRVNLLTRFSSVVSLVLDRGDLRGRLLDLRLVERDRRLLRRPSARGRSSAINWFEIDGLKMNCTIGRPRTSASISESAARGTREHEIRPAARPEALVDQPVDDADDGGPHDSEPQDVRDRDVPPAAAGDGDREARDAGHRDDHEALRVEEAPLARDERQDARVGAGEPGPAEPAPPCLLLRSVGAFPAGVTVSALLISLPRPS